MAEEAAFEFEEGDRAPVLALRGDWTVDTIAGLETRLHAVSERLKPGAVVDVSKLGRMDVAGAFLIDRTFRESPSGETTRVAIRGQHASAMQLLATARKAYTPPEVKPYVRPSVRQSVIPPSRNPRTFIPTQASSSAAWRSSPSEAATTMISVPPGATRETLVAKPVS